jgi:hypothetical protein
MVLSKYNGYTSILQKCTHILLVTVGFSYSHLQHVSLLCSVVQAADQQISPSAGGGGVTGAVRRGVDYGENWKLHTILLLQRLKTSRISSSRL